MFGFAGEAEIALGSLTALVGLIFGIVFGIRRTRPRPQHGSAEGSLPCD
jgi:hypothetical protein